VVDAPLFVDDSPNLSLMEIRAMPSSGSGTAYAGDRGLPATGEFRPAGGTGSKRFRDVPVAEAIAKELDVPVVAISQLNHGPEQRNDKRPLLGSSRVGVPDGGACEPGHRRSRFGQPAGVRGARCPSGRWMSGYG
jgi:replicative DNA helicase